MSIFETTEKLRRRATKWLRIGCGLVCIELIIGAYVAWRATLIANGFWHGFYVLMEVAAICLSLFVGVPAIFARRFLRLRSEDDGEFQYRMKLDAATTIGVILVFWPLYIPLWFLINLVAWIYFKFQPRPVY